MGKLTKISFAAAFFLLSTGFSRTQVMAEPINESKKAVVVVVESGPEKGDEHNEYCSITDPDQKSPIKFACLHQLTDCSEAEEVVKTMATYSKAYVSQDYKTCAEYMTDGITTFDQRSKRLIVGKEAVLADMKARLDKSLPDSDSPLLSYTLDHPLARVNGDKAYANCIGIKVYGGKNPHTMESHSTYIFVKEGGKWKKSHFTTDWRPIEPKG
jgi:ketosteroid isomerase-like protein